MRLHTHDRTQKIETNKTVKIMLGVGFGLLIALFLFTSVVCSIYANSIMPAVIILTTMILLAMLIVITQKDMDKAYVEVVNDVITVADYYFGIKKEKTFFAEDIGYAEILIGYSMRVRGYRYSNAGMTYIVFRDKNGKYMFKLICVPETKEFFVDYLKQ